MHRRRVPDTFSNTLLGLKLEILNRGHIWLDSAKFGETSCFGMISLMRERPVLQVSLA